MIISFLNQGGGGTGSGVTPAEVNSLIQSAITQGEYINNAEYISSAKTIVLYQDETEVATIDATAFIKDGMVDNVYISGTNLVIDFNTDSGKQDIEIPLSDIFDPSNYYTKTDVDAIASGKQDTLISGTNIKTINNESLLGSGNINISGGGSSNFVELTQAEYDALVSGGTVDPDSLYIITDASEVNLSGYAESSAVTAEIAAAVSGKADTSAVTQSLSSKQDTLVSGTNIKTINNESLLGSGNIDIQGGGGATYSAGTNISIDSANTISCTLNLSNGTGIRSIVIGENCTANNMNSFATGQLTKATGEGSHSEGGGYTEAQGRASHSEGWMTKSVGNYSHSEGYGSTANTDGSHTEGYYVIANNTYEHSQGLYNVSNTAATASGQTLFSVGNGTSNSARHNAFEIRKNGDIYVNDGTSDVRLQDTITGTAANTTALGGLKLVSLTQSEYDQLATKDSTTIYFIKDNSN